MVMNEFIVENKRPAWCHLIFLFHFLCAQHVSDINISIIRSLRLFCCITTLVVCSWFDVCWCFGVDGLAWCPCCRLKLQPATRTPRLMMDMLMSETCWAHKKWNKNNKWHQVGLLFSTITMMHGPINIRTNLYLKFAMGLLISIINYCISERMLCMRNLSYSGNLRSIEC